MLRLASVVLVLGAAACGPDPLTCAELARDGDAGMLTCDPLYPPTFDNVYENTLEPYCDQGGCHRPPAAKGRLDLSEIETAYDALLAPAEDRVILGDPECSELVARMATRDSDWHMPPGENLPDSHVCSIAMWIELGAPR